MAIRFVLPDDGADCVGFAYSPLLETVLSLHVLVEPKHHPLQHPWVRRMRRLPPELKRSISELGFVFARLVPDLFGPPPDAPFRTFEEEVAILRALDDTTIALELLRPLYDHEGKRDARLLRRPAVRRRVRAVVGSGAGSIELAELIFDDPRRLLDRLADLLERYWAEAFADEWELLEPQLAETVAEAGATIASEGVFALLESLPRRLRIDRGRGEFGLDIPHEHRVEVTPERRLLFVPSGFVWPHVLVSCDEPWPLSLTYPAPFVARAARPQLPSAELLGVLKAVGDDTRLRALRLIAERPRSTQELAPLVGISEAGLSKHLRQLAQAGLVASRRDGYYVLYSLVQERIEPLSGALLSLLGCSAG